MNQPKKTEETDMATGLLRRTMTSLETMRMRLDDDVASMTSGLPEDAAKDAAALARAVASCVAEARKCDEAARKAAGEQTPEEEDASMLDWYRKLPKARRQAMRSRLLELS